MTLIIKEAVNIMCDLEKELLIDALEDIMKFGFDNSDKGTMCAVKAQKALATIKNKG